MSARGLAFGALLVAVNIAIHALVCCLFGARALILPAVLFAALLYALRDLWPLARRWWRARRDAPRARVVGRLPPLTLRDAMLEIEGRAPPGYAPAGTPALGCPCAGICDESRAPR